ncbi:MAG: hypothetical protein DMD42_00100 [Gemmatimonadetes bacterium]|nr:MAG: hypothetical protein DMD42_00100 [Gemmatimonadota bacterium]
MFSLDPCSLREEAGCHTTLVRAARWNGSTPPSSSGRGSRFRFRPQLGEAGSYGHADGAAGGKTQGLQKTIAATLSGVVWVWLAIALIWTTHMSSWAWIIIGVVAFMLVLQSRVQILSFIPGAFCGAAVTAWAAPSDPKGYLMVAVALVAGAVLGYISEMGAGMIAKKA